MCRGKTHTYLNGDTCCLAHGKLTLLSDIILQGNAFNEFHNYIIIALILTDIEYINDVRICKTGCGLSFATELGNKSSILAEFRLHNFNGYESI